MKWIGLFSDLNIRIKSELNFSTYICPQKSLTGKIDTNFSARSVTPGEFN